MGQKSPIEWTESTWNPVTGCTKISDGCKNCYAEKLAIRLRAMGQANYRNGFALTLQPQAAELPLKWKKPQTIFVNSMSDLFHTDIPLDYIKRVFDVMAEADWHYFQILTKRSDRLKQVSSEINWQPHIWQGVSVENSKVIHRIDDLRESGAHVKFLSIEPLLGSLPNLDLSGIDWVIVGGESGPRARAMEESWVLEIKAQCESAGVPFFFKQWGGIRKHKTGRTLLGRTWDEMPKLAYA
jgi:protein gp37